MKWWKALGVIVAVITATQLIKWILDSLGVGEKLGIPLTFFISAFLSLFLVIILILNQIQGEHKKMKDFLKSKGYIEEEGFMENLLKRNGKIGMIDSRILWVVVILLILYILYKAGFLG